MQFKKVDVLISENLTREQLKEKVLTELNKISRASNPRISYIANIHDIFNGKYWICMDSETKETMGVADELIDLQSNLINKHTANFNNPHRTTVSNLTDTTITNPQRNQALVYDGTKWVNKSVSLGGSNYAKKNEANIFTKKQSGIDGTEDANFVTLRQLKTKVGLTGNETIAGVKTFSSPIIIPNATANNHSLPLGQADNRYSKLLTQNLEWTVGTGGKFTNLNDALGEALKYNKSNIIVIKLKSGFVFNEKIVLSNANFNNVIIRSEDAIVKVNPNNAVFSDTLVNHLFLSNYSITPIIDIKVDLNPSENSNSTKKIVFLGLYQNSRGIIAENKGCMNAVWDAIMVDHASTLFAPSCVIENAGYDGVVCSHGSIVNISNATIKGTARYGIFATKGGYVAANGAKIINQTQGTLLVCHGAIIYAHELVATGSTATQTNIPPNQTNFSGIIFK
ncbi:hypothetical protein PYY25_001805 [Campylobacter coli]|nr:hypothetical protein [Campylobacter coli]